MNRKLNLERDEQTQPVCPHCQKQLNTVKYRELHGAFWGKRYFYFCPSCRAALGVSHRKGFFMG